MKTISQSPTDPDFVQDPYPHYARMRGMGDLVWWDEYAKPCASSHAAVYALLRDRRFGREMPPDLATPTPPHLAPFYNVEAHSMLESEPPRHTRLRGLVLRAFTSRRINAMAPEITALTHSLVDTLPPGPFDLLPHFARKLPVILIARLLGVPESMADQLLAWSGDMVAMYQAGRTRTVEEKAAFAANDFTIFLRRYIETRRAAPRDDLITHLIAAEDEGAKLSTEELISTCILLLNAGHEATVHTLGNGVKALIENAQTATPDTAVGITEEILRFDPPLHMFTRIANQDMTVLGHDFRRGDEVALLLASANRDASLWPDADRFDPTRLVTPHSSLGGGIHFCVGAPLARLEMQIALPILFDRLPDLRLTSPPRYADSYHFHGLEHLMVDSARRH